MLNAKQIWSKVQYPFYVVVFVIVIIVIAKLTYPLADMPNKKNADSLESAKNLLTKIKEYYNLSKQDSNLLVSYDHATSAINCCDVLTGTILPNMPTKTVKNVLGVDPIELRAHLLDNKQTIKQKIKDSYPHLIGSGTFS